MGGAREVAVRGSAREAAEILGPRCVLTIMTSRRVGGVLLRPFVAGAAALHKENRFNMARTPPTTLKVEPRGAAPRLVFCACERHGGSVKMTDARCFLSCVEDRGMLVVLHAFLR